MPMKFDSKPGSFWTDSSFVDGSDAYANKKQAWITIRYATVPRAVVFKAFITNFSDSFNTNFDSEEILGRTNPIIAYKNTKRVISLGFDVVASTDEEAIANLEKIQHLAQYMYGTYSDGVLLTGPVIQLGFMNLITSQVSVDTQGTNLRERGVEIQDNETGGYTANYNNQFESTTEYGKDGLPGIISSLSYDFNLQDNTNNVTVGTGAIFSKKISVSISYEPQHAHEIHGNTTSENTNFPYGVNLNHLTGELKRRLVVDPQDKSDKLGFEPPKMGHYTSEAKRAFILGDLDRGPAGSSQTNAVSTEQINAGSEFLNNAIQEHKTRLGKLKETQQQLDMAQARYNSLFGGGRDRDRNIRDKDDAKGRLKRDIRRAEGNGRRADIAQQNVDAYYGGSQAVSSAESALTEPYNFPSE